MVTLQAFTVRFGVRFGMPLDPSALDVLKLGRRAPGAPSRRGRYLLLVAAVLLGFGALKVGRPRATEVETLVASAPDPSGRTTVLNASGYVVARRVATVASKVTGRIVEVHVEEGALVHAGDVLARLDPSTAAAAAEVARRARDSARRSLSEVEVRLADAERTLVRNQELAARKLVPQSVLDTAGADVAALKARLEVLRADVASSEAVVHQREQDLEDLIIRAPFTGMATSKDAQPGEMVSPISAGGGFTRTGIATIVDMDSRELEVDVNEAYIQRVHPGQAVEARLDAYPDAPLPAHVINIVPTADRQKATIKVRIGLDALEARILPDMGVKARFLEAAPEGSAPVRALIPASAVVGEGAARAVYRITDGVVHRVPVAIVPTGGDDLGVASGLAPGDVVVARPDGKLADGGRVVVKGGG
jgi:RND family efflux transporter MFP subunit